MPHHIQPYFLDDPEPWAIRQERQRHEDALWRIGELIMFCLLWNVDDYNKGLVTKCQTCNQSSRISQVYNQPEQNKCPDCYGTNFSGGYRALVIRPGIITDGEPGNQLGSRGVSYPRSLSFESTTDFRARAGDYVFRADGSRYQLKSAIHTTLRTGFATPYTTLQGVGYSVSEGAYEDPSSVAYMIPPDANDLADILTNRIRLPQDKDEYEDIRAYLIPEPHDFPGSRKNVVNLDKSLSGDPENPYGEN